MSDRNLQRASFLKSRRRRLTPEECGLPRSQRRRVSTLRREDVAWLADVGITWYTWLEQGRPIKIAADTLARIAAALRLDASETEYLQKLVASNSKETPHWDAPVAAHVRLLVENYTDGYAFVVGPRWDILAWNDGIGKLYDLRDDGRNLGETLNRNGLWLMFTRPDARSVFPDWEASARRMAATFRVKYADYLGDAGFGELIDALVAISPDFSAMWADVDVLSPKRWSVGDICEPGSHQTRSYETATFAIPDSAGQTLVFYVPSTEVLTAR
ncbi:MAG: hypothetical protein QOD51_2126 [Candidatus Eremiobacteraeota bacterium]|jgi:transcriptional regulator with XRE-family HTH domain|nr:hypothetical protein [Candidatus Eremiobacteraeota bacterium]